MPEEKRSKLVPVRMTPAEYERVLKAKQAAWPGARMSDSSALLSLAMLEADRVLEASESTTPNAV